MALAADWEAQIIQEIIVGAGSDGAVIPGQSGWMELKKCGGFVRAGNEVVPSEHHRCWCQEELSD